MKADPLHTNSGEMRGDAYAKTFRNQATGIGASLTASRETGRMRSQRVIDGAPPAQLRCADRSYPAANPEMDPKGTLRDRMTGKVWAQSSTGPHL